MSYRKNPRSKDNKPAQGVLTEHQREFLESDGQGYTDQNKRDYYNAISRQVHNAILDFSILFHNWPENERDEVFHELMDETGSVEGLSDVFAFLYSATRKTGAFTEALKQGVRKAEYKQSPFDIPTHAIQPTFEVERSPEAGLSAVGKYQRGPDGIAELTDREARMLIRALYIDDTLDESSVVQAELRFQKFLDGEAPDELETKEEILERMKREEERMSECYKSRRNDSEDSRENDF